MGNLTESTNKVKDLMRQVKRARLDKSPWLHALINQRNLAMEESIKIMMEYEKDCGEAYPKNLIDSRKNFELKLIEWRKQ